MIWCCLLWLGVLYLLDRVWSSKECVCYACYSSMHLSVPDQHAQVNCLYELSLAKSNHRIIDGFDPDEITDIINAIATG